MIQDDFSVEIQHILSSIFCFHDRESICTSITKKKQTYLHVHNNTLVRGWQQATRSFPLLHPVLQQQNQVLNSEEIPLLPSLVPEQEVPHVLSSNFYVNKNIWMPIYSWNEGKAALWVFRMVPECIIFPALRSRIVFVSPGKLKQILFLQVHERKQFSACLSLRRCHLPWTPHSGHSSFSISMNKQILLQLV